MLETAIGAVGDGLGDGSVLGVVRCRGVEGGKAVRGGAHAATTSRIPTETTAQPFLTTCMREFRRGTAPRP